MDPRFETLAMWKKGRVAVGGATLGVSRCWISNFWPSIVG
jgi:hypothetical protein